MSQDTHIDSVNEQKVLADQNNVIKSLDDREEQQAVAEYSKNSKDLSMKVHIYSPFNDYYDGQAFSLTAQSATGPFDILPKHHNFISLLEPCDLVVRTVAAGEQKIRISGGLIHVRSNQVIIFLDI
jgi:hypothetical protein